MICPRCGTKIKNGATSCMGCGLIISGSPDGSVKGPGDVDTVSLLSDDSENTNSAEETKKAVAADPAKDKDSEDKTDEKRENNTARVILKIAGACVLLGVGLLLGILIRDANQFDMRESLECAERMMSENNIGIAEDEYREILAVDPKNVEAIIGLSECLKIKGDTEGTKAALEDGYSLTNSKIIGVYIDNSELFRDK